MDDYVCPFRAGAESPYCIGRKCAWWVRRSRDCAVSVIARALPPVVAPAETEFMG